MWLFDTMYRNTFCRLIFSKTFFLIRIIIIYFIADSNKRTRDVVEEFENDARLSNYNTDGVRKVLVICFTNIMT